MSIPHTGKLTASVNGIDCSFDGDTWLTSDSELTKLLNEVTENSPKTHFSIRELAEHVLNKTSLLAQSKILSSESDKWNSSIPAEAED